MIHTGATQQSVWASPAFIGTVAASILAHAFALVFLIEGHAVTQPKPHPHREPLVVTVLSEAKPPPPAPLPARSDAARPQVGAPDDSPAPMMAMPAEPGPVHQLASRDAPPPPSAEEWQQAATYTLKNSKRYRYAWGEQVRSMMGTAVEGTDQGDVRFQVEIAPDGHLVRLDTIWSTSDTAERLAREAMRRMPPLPPTPTGKPLVFEKTISFQPRDAGWPPIYKDDCLPDPPGFKNPFVWSGSETNAGAARNDPVGTDHAAATVDENCVNKVPADTVEAVAASVERQFKTWGSLPLNGVK